MGKMGKGIKIALAVLMIVSVVGLGFTGCAKEAAAPTTPTTPAKPGSTTPTTPTTPTTAVTKVKTLKFASALATTSYLWEPAMLGFKEEVEEKSGGRYKIDYYPSQSLLKIAASLDGLRTGIAEMIGTCSSWHAGFFRMDEIYAIPGFMESAMQGTVLRNALFDEFNKPEWDSIGVVEIGGRNTPPYNVFTKSVPIYTVEDFKGLSVRTVYRMEAVLLTDLNAIPVHMPSFDVYESMQKGMIDAATYCPAYAYQYQIHETGKPGYFSYIGGTGMGPMQRFLNKEFFDNLSQADQDMFMELGDKYFSIMVPTLDDETDIKHANLMMDYGTQFIWWTDAEMERLNQTYKVPLFDQWAEEMDAAGYPGSAMVAKLLAIQDAIPLQYPLDPKWAELKTKAGF
ncbi:TRAP transporter substrate-binding protein DctP [Chloroflexota bacterium]